MQIIPAQKLDDVADLSELVIRSKNLAKALEEALTERRYEVVEELARDIIINASQMKGWMINHRDDYK